jgi:hypothetical protein
MNGECGMVGVGRRGREVLGSEFWVLSLGMRGEAELGMVNGECGMVGRSYENFGPRTVVRLGGIAETGTAVYGGPVPWLQIRRLVSGLL